MTSPHDQGRPPQPGPRQQPPGFRPGFQASGQQRPPQGQDWQPQGQQGGYGQQDPYYQPQQPQQGYYDYPQQPSGRQQHPTNAPVSLPPKPKRKKWPFVLLGLFLLFIVIVFASCAALFSAADTALNAEHKLTYTVEGSGTATVTYGREGGSGQEANVKLPWTSETTTTGISWGTVTATLGQNGGNVTCRITAEDGTVVAENSASGAFASANCFGSAPPGK